MKRSTRTGIVAALLSVIAARPAHAHLLPPQHCTLNVRDSAVFGAFSIPVSAFTGWDDDHDGRMSDAELAAHRASVLARLDAGIVITSGGAPGRRDLLLPSIEQSDAAGGERVAGTHLLVLVRQSFTAVPAQVTLRMAIFGTAETERAYLVRATNHGPPEVGNFSAASPSREFFQPTSSLVSRDRLMPLAPLSAILILCVGAAWRAPRRRALTPRAAAGDSRGVRHSRA